MIYLYDTAGDRCSACEGMYGLRCLERPTVTPAFGIHLCAIHAPGWNAHDAAKKRRILNAAIDGLLDQDITLEEISNEVVRRRGAWKRGEGVDQTVLAAERTVYLLRLSDEAERDEIREAAERTSYQPRLSDEAVRDEIREARRRPSRDPFRRCDLCRELVPGVAFQEHLNTEHYGIPAEPLEAEKGAFTKLLERDQQTFDRFFPEPNSSTQPDLFVP